jgi:hypothetical protein
MIHKLLIAGLIFALFTWIVAIPVFWFVTGAQYWVPALLIIFSTLAVILYAVALGKTRRAAALVIAKSSLYTPGYPSTVPYAASTYSTDNQSIFLPDPPSADPYTEFAGGAPGGWTRSPRGN